MTLTIVTEIDGEGGEKRDKIQMKCKFGNGELGGRKRSSTYA